MARNIPFLLVILIMQISIVIYVGYGSHDIQQSTRDQVLFDADESDAIDKIIIVSVDNKLTIEKKEGNWSLPEYHGLLANKDLIDSLITKLKSIKTSWVVAQTKSAAQRFRVADENNKRQLILYANGKKLLELFFGDSPGLNSIYIRRASEDKIHSVKLGLHLLSTKKNDWFDKNILQVNTELTSLSGDGFKLIKKSASWLLDDLNSDEVMNIDEVNLLVSYLQKIQVEGRVDDIDKNPDLSFIINAGEQQIKYGFFKSEEAYAVKSSQHEFFFKIAPYFYENMQKLQRENLLQ